MIAQELREEAISQANSKEGMDKLIHLLLFYTNDTRSERQKMLELFLLRRIVAYVKLKRIRQINTSHMRAIHKPLEEHYVSKEEIEAAKEDYKDAENLLLNITSYDYVANLKKQFGSQISYKNIKNNLFSYLDEIDYGIRLRRYDAIHSH